MDIDLDGFLWMLKKQTKTYWAFSLEINDGNYLNSNHLIFDRSTHQFKGPDEMMLLLKILFKIEKFDDLNIFFTIPEGCNSISFFYSKYFDTYTLFLYTKNNPIPYKSEGDDFSKAYSNLIINYMLKPS